MNALKNCNDRLCFSGLKNPFYCVLLFLSTGSATAAERGQQLSDPLLTSGLTQVVSGLLLVIMVILVITWVIKRVPGLQTVGQGSIRIVDALHVSTRERILLVQVGEQQMLLGVTAQNINTLHVLSEPVARTTNQSEMANRLVNLFSSRKGKLSQ